MDAVHVEHRSHAFCFSPVFRLSPSTVQQVIQVGKSGSTALPGRAQWVGELFNSASIINFDIEYFKPGCTGPVITFLQLFWITLGLCALTAFCFYIACRLRRW